jgi:diguanylate cyclase (GGDEF)-like protein
MTQGPTTTKPDKAEALLDVLEQMPVDLTIATADGESIYANKAGADHANDETGLAIHIEKLTITSGGQVCDVRVSYDVSEQRKLEDDLFRRAYFDDLTGLPNRALVERSTATLAGGGPDVTFALCFIDLDGFKNINDFYGHAAGDALLVKIGERLSRELRRTDMLARVGGDEFVLLISPATTVLELTVTIEGFLARLKEPFFIEGQEIFASASIGVSLFPADGKSFETLCANADRAMYKSKGGAKGGVHFYDSSVSNAQSERTRTEQRLRLAIRDQRIGCAYQPKVDFRSGEVVGLEVLLRWRDEDGFIHPPGDFVNLAVELGLMDEVTHLVLAETVGSIDRINDAFGDEVTISINVAAKQADQPAFMRSLVDALVSTGYPERFMLELTEEAFLSKSRFQSEVLPMIRAIGAKVSIDDFGVGYSSLAALADITADEIKVDRSFITAIHQRPHSQSILRAIESLATALDMSIIVEGVETFEELAYLQAATRIRKAQGYYFARPQFLDEFAQKKTLQRDLRQATTAPRVAAGRVAATRSA